MSHTTVNRSSGNWNQSTCLGTSAESNKRWGMRLQTELQSVWVVILPPSICRIRQSMVCRIRHLKKKISAFLRL